MSLFSEIPIEATIQSFVKEIEEQLEKHKDDESVVKVLRELGRYALTLFDWDTPHWAVRYHKLFAEPQ